MSIPNSVTSIGETAFQGCSSLTSVSISNSVTSIGANAFGDCTSLISIEIPNSVTDFGPDAIKGCSSLTSIIIGRNVTSIWLSSSLSSLTNVVFNAVQCTSASFPETVEVLYIGKDVTTIPDKAFSKCTDLTDVYCYALEPFKILDTTFKVYENLHVLPGCGELYAQKDPWKRFTIKEDLEEPFDPDAQQCATPTVVYADGELIFECATNGATIKSEVTSEDVQKYTTDRIPLSATYTITAYAVKDGMNNSEKITATLHWLDGTLDADGVNATFASKRAVMVCASAGTVTVSGLEDGEAVELYTTSGRKLADTRANGNTAILPAKTGEVVIVKIAGQNMKVLSR